MSTNNTDYYQLYNNYWSRAERWGSHSYDDPRKLAENVIKILSHGKLLDVGCGMGLLVRTLLESGKDAYGVDVAERVVDEGNRLYPNRFLKGSILELPFMDNTFDTVVSTDCLEHIAEIDVPKALSELHRITRHSAFIQLSVAADCDGIWHLTIRDRSWWENQFFLAGFRKHPLTQLVVPFETLEHETWQITMVFEKIPDQALVNYPLSTLQEERNLHMDMLREPGIRSDAHIARYTLAREYLLSGMVVLDAACGLGYGSATLAMGTQIKRVIGVDSSRWAVDYARANYASLLPPLEFHVGDATELHFIPDGSVDAVISFETLEHLPNPNLLLKEFARVLKPGGIFIGSVPNMWIDELGQNPVPYHLHIYDYEQFHEQVAKYFIWQDIYRQNAGGGWKRPQGRSLRLINNQQPLEADFKDAEWWICVANKRISIAEKAINSPTQNQIPIIYHDQYRDIDHKHRGMRLPLLLKQHDASRPINILFYVEPLIDHQKEDFIRGSKYIITTIINTLNSNQGNVFNFKILANDQFKSYIDDVYHKYFRELSERVFLDYYQTQDRYALIAKSFRNEHSSDALDYFALKISELTGDFNPDLIVTSIPVPFLRQLYPKKLIFHVEAGLFSRTPYSMSLSFDPIGLWSDSFVDRFSNKLISTKLSESESKSISDIKRVYQAKIMSDNPFIVHAEVIKRKYKQVVLLSLPFIRDIKNDPEFQFDSIDEFLLNILNKIDSNVGVFLTTHPSDTEISSFIDKYHFLFPNVMYLQNIREKSASQYVIPFVDAIFNLSSKTALLSLFWNKPLLSLGKTLSGISDWPSIEEFNPSVNVIPRDKDALLYFLLTKYYVPEKYYSDRRWLVAFIRKSISNPENNEVEVDFFDSIDQDFDLIENMVQMLHSSI